MTLEENLSTIIINAIKLNAKVIPIYKFNKLIAFDIIPQDKIVIDNWQFIKAMSKNIS